jgi:chromate transporter
VALRVPRYPCRNVAARSRVTRAALFWGFLTVSLSGFGGVMPFARRMLVERRKWLTEGEFVDLLSLCQFLPGPNIVNVAVCVGSRFQGPLGSLVSLAGLLIAPFALVLGLAALYTRFGNHPLVNGALAGVGAAAAGLVVAMGIRMALPFIRIRRAVLFAAVTFAAVALLRWPLYGVLALAAPLSIAAAWRRP